MNEIFVLGLDVSMNSTGWAVIGVKGQDVRLVDSGIVKANDKKPHGERLTKQRESFENILKEYKIKYVARESGFTRHKKATQALFKAYGVAEEYFSKMGLVEYAASTIKKVVTGSGSASKSEVEQAIEVELNLPEDFVFQSNDESDAMGVALTLVYKKDLQEGSI
ncbi:hypothetical protein CHL76_02315 [Marinococcus halophilus]|uniref:Uncharacterized protein n=1 Tax=Marinococcus halophilus TaxID=1371 RepID=A0A510Y1I5_MARHA|nr:crossover junction endodeoxyribonuclease RuvC [Marinococcus halophilus]OZT81210.1 hypothetical protein CHL76_02315 [Marinococcus halophilus]GEK57144.1 hypothetical protein MHA01_00490 [Marinococcus halophilus]